MLSSFDISGITARAQELMGTARNSVVKILPESMSSDKKFVNAVAVTCALITVADQKIEAVEVQVMLNLIKSIEQIETLDLTAEAINIYQTNVLEIEALLNNSNVGTDPQALFLMKTTGLLEEIALIKGVDAHVTMLRNLITHIMSACGKMDSRELEMKSRIEGVL